MAFTCSYFSQWSQKVLPHPCVSWILLFAVKAIDSIDDWLETWRSQSSIWRCCRHGFKRFPFLVDLPNASIIPEMIILMNTMVRFLPQIMMEMDMVMFEKCSQETRICIHSEWLRQSCSNIKYSLLTTQLRW